MDEEIWASCGGWEARAYREGMGANNQDALPGRYKVEGRREKRSPGSQITVIRTLEKRIEGKGRARMKDPREMKDGGRGGRKERKGE
jgi:hypothetical protein